MDFKKCILSLIMVTAISISCAMALGNDGTVTAKSINSKVQLTFKTLDAEPGVSDARLVTPEGTIDLSKYEPATIIDLPNHILTICFLQKANAGDPASTKPLKVWALPSSFVKIAGSENSWRFKVKIAGGLMKDVTTMDATFEWKP